MDGIYDIIGVLPLHMQSPALAMIIIVIGYITAKLLVAAIVYIFPRHLQTVDRDGISVLNRFQNIVFGVFGLFLWS